MSDVKGSDSTSLLQRDKKSKVILNSTSSSLKPIQSRSTNRQKEGKRSSDFIGNNDSDFALMLALEDRLTACTQELSDLRRLLADRDKQIVSLQRIIATNEKEKGPCRGCEEKDAMIGEILDKLDDPSLSQESSFAFDLDIILRNIVELNGILTENQKDIVAKKSNDGNGGVIAKFQAHPVTTIVFYANGFQMENQESYNDRSSRVFLQDLTDGFFPSELQLDYPEGVAILATDRRHQKGPKASMAKDKTAFEGKGIRLSGKTASSIMLPQLTSSSSSSLSSTCLPSSSSSPSLLLPPPRSSSLSTAGSSAVRQNWQQQQQQKTKNEAVSRTKSKRVLKPIEKRKRIIGNRDVRLKVMGLNVSQPLLISLVYYDTLKTLRGIVRNEILSFTGSVFTFDLFSCCPVRQKLTEEAMTLADLGLFPNAVVHVHLLKNMKKQMKKSRDN